MNNNINTNKSRNKRLKWEVLENGRNNWGHQNNSIKELKHYTKPTRSTVGAIESSHASAAVRVYSIGARSSILTRVCSTIVNI